MKGTVDIYFLRVLEGDMRIGIIIKKWRLVNEITIRDLAAEIGISAATLYRVETGRAPDGLTLIKIFDWLCHDTKKGGT
jgi:transcriptional regulator with XRE-family HTH domain